MITDRKLISGEKEVESFLNSASLAGLNVIELLWKKLSPSVKIHMGFDVPVFHFNGNNSRGSIDVDRSIGVSFQDGQTLFYPDKANYCWGYVADTKRNRDMIMKSLKTGWFRVQDKAIEKEILDEARNRGISTDVVRQEIIEVKHSGQEKMMMQTLKEKEKEIADLNAKLKALEV